MNDVYGKPIPPNVYEKNKTMKLLGRQCMATVFWRDDKVHKEIDEIAEARPYSFTVDAAADIFTLGYIYTENVQNVHEERRAVALHNG